MANRLHALTRSAGVLALGLCLTGATAATPQVKYIVRLQLADAGHANLLAPEFAAIRVQDDWKFVGGGEAPISDGRNIRYVDYGTRIEGSIHRDERDATAIMLDLTVAQTTLVSHPADMSEVTVGGRMAHTVRTIHLGHSTRIALGDAAGTTLDLTVDRQ